MKPMTGFPVKWTASKALVYQEYSSASDVWSFGIVMYEMWSLASKPYTSYTNSEVRSISVTKVMVYNV